MRYDSDSGKILISLSELVAISRRGVAGTLPFDEDEPGILRPSKRARRTVLGECDEVKLTWGFDAGDYAFELLGEADKLEGSTVTLLGSISGRPDSPKKEEERQLRGAAFILGYVYSSIEGLDSVELCVTYINEASGDVATRVEKVGRKDLEKFFNKCVNSVGIYARPEVERVTERLPSMKKLAFPYSAVRDGQGELVRSVYRCLARGTSLYACAPTGTGKTVSVIYPALRLLGEGRHEKVFYLTPKTTTAAAARDCLELFAREGAKIRGMVLTSKERSCPMSLACRRRRSACPYAECNRLADATLTLYNLGITVVTLGDVSRVASEYSVCPYELELSYSELCDVVICDINYLFDPRAYIRRFFDAGGRYAFLIDEAHNLAERAREMYSAEISTAELRALAESELIPPLSPVGAAAQSTSKSLYDTLFPYLKEEIRLDKDGKEIGATHLSDVPGELYSIFREHELLLSEELHRAYSAKDEDAEGRVELLRQKYYETKRVCDALAAFDSSYKLFLFYEGCEIRIKLFCVDTGSTVRAILGKGRGAVFFSATLSPLDYYKSILGGDGTSEIIEVRSPFNPECLSVSIMDKISTRYSERERTLPAVSRVIAATLSARRGKYMVFAPSFEYLEGLARDFRAKYPKIKILEQRRDMSAKEKADFLDSFSSESEGYLVGFCVMGGIYSEGIDLVGDSLIGAVVVGIGMPSLSYEREAMAEYYEEKYEAGKQYAYIYPGMNRVLQAAGRVIRREEDRGVIVLIDDRFDDPIYKKSIPSLWRGMEYVGDAKELNERLREFWRRVDSEKSE